MKSIATGMAAACLAAGFATTIATDAGAQGANVGGRYQVQGKNFNGSTYSGTAEITVTSNNTCRIVWVTGSTTSRGICMRNGNSFAASYVLGSKIGLDATNKWPPETAREWGRPIRMSDEVIRTVSEKWPRLGLPGSGRPIWR